MSVDDGKKPGCAWSLKTVMQLNERDAE